MRSSHPLLRLLPRPAVLWDVYVSTVIVALLIFIAARLRFLGSADVSDVLESDIPQLALEFSYVFFGASVISVVANFALQDLSYCKFSWSLPGLRLGLRQDMFVLAFFSLALAALFSFTLSHELNPVPALAAALFGFGVGNHLWDPHSSRWASILAIVASLFVAVFSIDLAESFVGMPWAGLALGASLTVISVAQTTSRTTMRRRALVPEGELGASFQLAPIVPRSRLEKLDRRHGHRVWSRGPIRSLVDWIAAMHYEDEGWRRGAWWLRESAMCVLFVLFCALVNLTELGLAGAAVMIVLVNRQDLRLGVHYPLSRLERASVVWVGAAAHSLVYLLGAMLAVVGVETLRRWTSPRAVESKEFLVEVALVLLCAGLVPFLQAGRLWWLDSQPRRAGLGRQLLFSSLCIVVFSALIATCSAALRDIDVSPAFACAGAILIWIVTQALYRESLHRWFAKRDLY